MADGKHAVDLIMNQRPRIALVDIGLPTIERLRRRAARSASSSGAHDIFLVALTGYGQQQDRDAVVSAGFDQHLVKPIEIDTLLEVLRLRRPLRAALG